MYLLDTVAFSELFRRRPHPGFVRWFADKSEVLFFLSVITIGEVEKGIERQRGTEPAFAEALLAWLERSLMIYADRILPVTPNIARRWGRLAGRLGRDDVDVLIAATALEHGLTVATRNVRHFTSTGVAIENPFGDRR
jgi:predicted nucleic acid-binding protein